MTAHQAIGAYRDKWVNKNRPGWRANKKGWWLQIECKITAVVVDDRRAERNFMQAYTSGDEQARDAMAVLREHNWPHYLELIAMQETTDA
jgi:hypothetical protein